MLKSDKTEVRERDSVDGNWIKIYVKSVEI